MPEPDPNIISGCDMKSVIRSSMLRGSRTKVGKVTLERSIPILRYRVQQRVGDVDVCIPQLGDHMGDN